MASKRVAPVRTPPGQRRARSGSAQVTLSESDGVRYLHFGSVWVQGAMRIARPFRLELEYQQQMMAPALYVPQPARIVQLGLGAAALAKACWKLLPAARVTAVEISAEVIAAAPRWFKLPADDRIELVHDDALAWISDPRRGGRARADWLQVDLYDAAARGPVYDDPAFYAACRRALARTGVAAINLFGRSFEPSRQAIAAAFGDDRLRVLPEADAGNRIVLAFAGPVPAPDAAVLYRRASDLEQRWSLPARRWASALRTAGAPEADGKPRIAPRNSA